MRGAAKQRGKKNKVECSGKIVSKYLKLFYTNKKINEHDVDDPALVSDLILVSITIHRLDI